MKTSIVPQLARLQTEAGSCVCCVCLKPLKRKGKTWPIACWSADCRSELSIIRGKHRRAQHHEALRSLTKIVASLGWSTKNLERLVTR